MYSILMIAIVQIKDKLRLNDWKQLMYLSIIYLVDHFAI